MKQYNLSREDLEKRFLEMGKKIGASYVKVVSPHSENLDSLLQEIYQITLRSKVKIIHENNSIIVQDSKCALCKYQYDDIDLAGCTISIGMIKEILEKMGYIVSKYKIVQSKAYGDNICSHEYQIEDKKKNKDEDLK